MGLVHFLVSCVYTIAGVSAFIVFLLIHFYSASVYGFVTAAISAVTAHINWLHKRRRLALWYEKAELSQLYWLGFFTFSLGFTGFVYHLVYYLLLHQYTERIDLAVACIWGFITVKAGAILMFYTSRYVREAEGPNLLVRNEEQPEA